MLTSGFKLFFGFCLSAILAAVVFGYTTGGRHIGPITAGYKGPVGNHLGYVVLLSIGIVSGAIGLLLVAFRDADARSAAELLGVDELPAQRPVTQSIWPLVAAVAMGLIVLGLVVHGIFFVSGLVLLAVAGVEWMMQAWADRATGDPSVNAELRRNVMAPYEMPVLAVLMFAFVIVCASRVFLAASKEAAVWLAMAIAGVIMVGAIVAAMRPNLPKRAGTALIGLFVVLIVGAGIVAAAQGEREFEAHESVPSAKPGKRIPLGPVGDADEMGPALPPTTTVAGGSTTTTVHK